MEMHVNDDRRQVGEFVHRHQRWPSLEPNSDEKAYYFANLSCLVVLDKGVETVRYEISGVTELHWSVSPELYQPAQLPDPFWDIVKLPDPVE